MHTLKHLRFNLQHERNFCASPNRCPSVSELLDYVEHLVSRLFAQHVIHIISTQIEIKLCSFWQRLDASFIRLFHLVLVLHNKILFVFIFLLNYLNHRFFRLAAARDEFFHMVQHSLKIAIVFSLLEN